ncbi:MAG: tRNA 2-thiouridine(34) synthase MnmA [Coxiella sp. RIFCSPHIGHO2_12_FULL_44_14]|nr:MAG: tRNA 2-thiouridine(34) synthase MnmA [Coxiella sp. RIFCSPHIGHO2_12_FULL_44_14]
MTKFDQNQTPSPSIMVGLSGGVDSAVAALLLKRQGIPVIAGFMQNWEGDREDPFCSADQDLSDAKAVCDQLDIPLITVNLAKVYWERVFQRCLLEWAAGRTPNPDIGCNRDVKFKAFLDYAQQHGTRAIATGHYARIECIDGHYHLAKSADPEKDQTYFLYALNQSQLADSLFPIGHLNKSEVRAIAKKADLINHAKKDSTGICFIGERRLKPFLREFLLAQPGLIETLEGKVVGSHDGLMFYTIGQRHGLQIGGCQGSLEKPWYVVAKETSRNILIVAQGHDHPALYKQKLVCTETHWIRGTPPPTPYTATAKTRYRQPEQVCEITHREQDRYTVTFEEPQRAITPGQSVVFYQGDYCLGGGIIA